MFKSSTASPSPAGEYASKESALSAIFICCHPAAPVVITVFLFDHCWPLLSTIFMKSSVAAGASIQNDTPVAPVKSLYPNPPS